MESPKCSASICVTAAQHQLRFSCGLNVLGILPVVSGSQHPAKESIKMTDEKADTTVIFITSLRSDESIGLSKSTVMPLRNHHARKGLTVPLGAPE